MLTDAEILVLQNLLKRNLSLTNGEDELSNQEKFILARFNWFAERGAENRLELVKLALRANIAPHELTYLCKVYYDLIDRTPEPQP